MTRTHRAPAALERLGSVFDALAADEDFDSRGRVLVGVVVADVQGRTTAAELARACADDEYALDLADAGEDDGALSPVFATVLFRLNRNAAVAVLRLRHPELAFALRTPPLPGFVHAVALAGRESAMVVLAPSCSSGVRP